MKRLALIAVPLLMLLAACGGGSTTANPSAVPSMPVVQPCDALDLAPVEKILGHGLTENTGTDSAPDCTLTPTVTGGAIFRLNYQWWFKGGLDAALKKVRKQITGAVTTVHVPDADAAKLIVGTSKKYASVTGFVEDDNLIQVVNAEALIKNAAKLRRATLLLMAQISRGAPSTATASAEPSA